MPPPSGLPGASTAPRAIAGDDLAIVRRAVLAADPAAVEDVLARLSCVVRFVFRLNRSLGYGLPTDVLEDVVQQVYASMWPRLRDYNGVASLESWAFGFCRNCLRAEARRRSNRLRLLPGSGQEGDGPGIEEKAEATAAPPDGEASRREGQELLRDELDRLDADERQIVELRFFEDRSFEQIARDLGEAPSTVKDRCYRALQRLKTRLRKRDVDA